MNHALFWVFFHSGWKLLPLVSSSLSPVPHNCWQANWKILPFIQSSCSFQQWEFWADSVTILLASSSTTKFQGQVSNFFIIKQMFWACIGSCFPHCNCEWNSSLINGKISRGLAPVGTCLHAKLVPYNYALREETQQNSTISCHCWHLQARSKHRNQDGWNVIRTPGLEVCVFYLGWKCWQLEDVLTPFVLEAMEICKGDGIPVKHSWKQVCGNPGSGKKSWRWLPV